MWYVIREKYGISLGKYGMYFEKNGMSFEKNVVCNNCISLYLLHFCAFVDKCYVY